MHDLTSLLITVGYVGFFAIIFLETALPVCFFLPGDSLLLAAGILLSQGTFSFGVLWLLGITAAIIGGFAGYALGAYLGPRVFSDTRKGLLHTKHRLRAEAFYTRYGTFAIVAARFVPIVRTFISTLAGVGNMNTRRFALTNIFGGVLWIVVVSSVGYFIGEKFPQLAAFIPHAFVFVIVASFIPFFVRFIKKWYVGKKRA